VKERKEGKGMEGKGWKARERERRGGEVKGRGGKEHPFC